jgi:hypothetical protein
MLKKMSWASVGVSLLVALVLIGAGCGPQGDTKGGPDKGTPAAKTDEKSKEDCKHTGFWCEEHGLPEAECSPCNSKVAAEFKRKGDWCDQHDRALSQCFVCNPKAKEKYAAVYRAKYGKEPPPLEEEKEEM